MSILILSAVMMMQAEAAPAVPVPEPTPAPVPSPTPAAPPPPVEVPTAETPSTITVKARPIWIYEEGRDPVTDLPTAKMRARSKANDAWLVVRCDGISQHTVSVQFLPKRPLGLTPQPVTVRVGDDSPVTTVEWESVSGGTFNRVLRDVKALGVQLAKEKPLFLRALNSEKQPVDAEFETAGAAPLLGKVLKTCKYEPL